MCMRVFVCFCACVFASTEMLVFSNIYKCMYMCRYVYVNMYKMINGSANHHVSIDAYI